MSSDLPEIGQRVVLTADAERFPYALVSAGGAGSVAWADGSSIGVRLDERHDGLAGWDNVLIWERDMECPDGGSLAEAFWSGVSPEEPAPSP